MTAAVRDLVDELDALDLADLARLASPCLSVYLPTGRTHHDAGRAPLELRALLDEAREDLSDDRRDLAGPAFDRAASLVGDKRFWNEQGEGLAVFATPDALRVIRLADDPGRRVHLADHPHLIPLLSGIQSHASFYLLVIGLGRVRLFSGTWAALEEMDLGPIPASAEDMERRHAMEPELQHQHTPAMRATASFHGHGGREVSDVIVDKFVLEVATGVRRRIGAASTAPVYLAGVEEYLPRLQATNRIPGLRPRMLPGAWGEAAAHELLEQMRPLLLDEADEREHELRARLDRAAATALLATDAEGLRRAVSEGRVDTLVVDPTAVGMPDADIDELVVRTMHQGGAVRTSATLPDEATVVGVLRY